MGLHPDFKDFLTEFERAEARYLLVGGYAVGFHGRPRFTKDLDILIGEDATNLERVIAAMTIFGAPSHLVDELRMLAPNEILYLGAAPIRIDVFRRIPGVDFETAYDRRVQTEWDGVGVSVIGLEDLIAAKKATAREQDLLDVKELERTRRL